MKAQDKMTCLFAQIFLLTELKSADFSTATGGGQSINLHRNWWGISTATGGGVIFPISEITPS
jgi:hypothetical protein